MNLLLLILIVFFVVIVFLSIALRFVKKVVRITILVIICILVLSASIYVMKDANDLRKDFLLAEKLLLLDLNGDIVAGVINKDVSEPVPLNSLDDLNEAYHEKNYEDMLNKHYKLLVFDWDSFKDLEYIEYDDDTISLEDINKIMKSENPKDFFIDRLVEKKGEPMRSVIAEQVEDMFPTDDFLRSVIFGFMIAKSFEKRTVFDDYVNGNVFIFPETITLRSLKILPISWMRGFLPEKLF
jgi:hypothetical protein